MPYLTNSWQILPHFESQNFIQQFKMLQKERFELVLSQNLFTMNGDLFEQVYHWSFSPRLIWVIKNAEKRRTIRNIITDFLPGLEQVYLRESSLSLKEEIDFQSSNVLQNKRLETV